jgi:hypothetical protein
MNLFFLLLKKIFLIQKKDEFFYIEEKFKHHTDAENHKVTYLSSYKKIG